MILICDDFSYEGKTLKSQKYISVNFDNDTELPSSITREMEASNMNKYRTKETGFGISYTDTLEFDVHIMKDYCVSSEQTSLRFSAEEYDAAVAWLTSSQENAWMDITVSEGNIQKVKGYFSSVTPFDSGGICYGIRCTFTCNSPFSYVEKKQTQNVNGVMNFLINNESSDWNDYVYPVISISPTQTEDIFIHNLSDSIIVENGAISISEDAAQNISFLQNKINSYAMVNGLTVSYVIDEDTQDLKLICNNTALLFYMTDSYGVKKKYVAYYLENEQQYFICCGGFFYCTVNQSLDIYIDCENLGFYDALNRPVLFTKLDIQDEDEIYWMRLIHGNNTFRVSGHFEIEIQYYEPRKGMLIE